MNPDELPDYVASKRKEGLSDNTIRTILLNARYSRHDIEVAIAAGTLPPPVGQTPAERSVPPPSSALQPQSSSAALKPFFPELFKIYRTRFWALLGATLITVIMPGAVGIIIALAVIPLTFVGLAIFQAHMVLGIILAVTLFTLGFLLEMWLGSVGGIALLNIALGYEEKVGIGASLKVGFKKAWSYLWLAVLMGLIIGGAFVLLIVPGIFLSIAFSLTWVVFLAEDQHFADAFLRSRDLVKGHWWYVCVRMLVVGVVPIIVLAIVRAYWGTVGAIIQVVLSVLLIPLSVSASVVLFKNLQSLKPAIEASPSARKWKYALFILPLAILFALLIIFFPFIVAKLESAKPTVGAGQFGATTNSFLSTSDLMAESRDSNRVSDIAMLKSLIGLYAADGGTFSACKSKTLYASAPITPPAGWQVGANAGKTAVDGSGWLPFDFASIQAGSPFRELPLDPVNDPSKGLVYVMACDPSSQSFKFEAGMESSAYNQGGSEDMVSTDGGIDPNLYENGSNLSIDIPKYY